MNMNHKNPTMEDVARKAGVSITTVSHVINKTRYVNKDTKEAVLEIINKLNYRSSKSTKSNDNNGNEICVGVILADVREDYYLLMMKAIETVATEYNVSVIFCDSGADYKKEEQNIKLLLDKKVNGLLLAPADADQMPQTLKNISIPVILIDRQYESHSFFAVGINNFLSGYLGTKNLFNKQCKNIGFIGYFGPVYTIRQRIQGYKSAVMEHKPTAVPKVLYLEYNGDSFPLIKQFLAEHNFDGLICATSSLCYELIEVFDTLEESAKSKIKIICFDDNRWLDYLKYPISVISQPVVDIGNAAFENLLKLIEQSNNICNIKRELFFEVTIIDR